MVKPCHLVRPVTQILARPLTHQEGLPKLPVPPLNQTCERYLAALEPLISDEEMDHTRKVVQDFLKGGVGERLQKGLERRARKTDNWVDKWIYLTLCVSVDTMSAKAVFWQKNLSFVITYTKYMFNLAV